MCVHIHIHICAYTYIKAILFMENSLQTVLVNTRIERERERDVK